MKSIAYSIAGSVCIVAAVFAPGISGFGAVIWSGIFFCALLMRDEP